MEENKDLLEINFIYQNKTTSFEYNKEEIISHIIQNFCKKLNLDYSEFKFIYKGNQIDIDERIMNIKEGSSKKMDIYLENKGEKLVSIKLIIGYMIKV